MNTVNGTTIAKEVEDKKIFKYKKRSGTAETAGPLYRSQLLSLILSRNLNHGMKFVLGCYVGDIGVMNEICFKFVDKDNNTKPVAVFIKTKYAGYTITDKDLSNPTSAYNLFKCYQSQVLIKERFDNVDDDAFFERTFDNITPYFVIYTPHQSKIGNQVEVPGDDKIYTDKVNSIIGTGSNNKIFKIPGKGLVTALINAKIEMIGKTIAAYVTSDVKDREVINIEMKNVLKKYCNFLIPDVIKINEIDKNCYGEFNESMYENTNCHIKLLRKVLFEEILKKSPIIDEDASTDIQLLLEAKEYSANVLSKLVGTVITFNEYTNKLAYMPGVSDFIKSKSLDKILVNKTMADDAFVIAGMKSLKCIKIHLNDLSVREVIAKQADGNEQKKSETVFEDEKQIAEWFLNHFYVYAEQGKENDVNKQLKDEIIKSQATENTTVFQTKIEAMLVELHSKVQKWTLLMDNPQYLTDNCDFMKYIPNIVNPHLSILNYNCNMELQGHFLKFNRESFNLFSQLDGAKSCINIISNDVLLTSIKLMQYFLDKSCLFVNFDNVCNMKDMEFNMLLQEVKKTTVKTFVVIFSETKKHTAELNQFKEIVSYFPGNVFAVSKYHVEDFQTIYDTIRGLEDIDNANEVLKHVVTVQGQKVELSHIVDEKCKNIINAGILKRIVKNENIEIGQSLSNSSYSEIKKCFINRQLCAYAASCDDFTNHIRSKDGEFYTNTYSHYNLGLTFSFDFLSKDAIVGIFAEPGMGKSSLLTHLSVEMKSLYPERWIVKINLPQYSKDFYKWDKELTDGIEVDIIKSLHLICRAELNNKAFDELFTLEISSDGDLVLLESKELDLIASLHLKRVIHCFNSGNVIFLFDGFDEICPHYEKVVVQFMKNLVIIDKGECSDSTLVKQQINHYMLTTEYVKEETESINQIWVTSRPYNVLKTTLEKQFNIKPLYITRLSTYEQLEFYKKYWETRIKLEDLNSDQFKNVEAFFKYINQYHYSGKFISHKFELSTNILFRRMQEAAVDYLRSNVNSSADSNIDKKNLLSKWISVSEMITTEYGMNWQAGEGYLDQLQLAGIPLHMKIHADLFVHEIKDTSSTKIWDMGVHTFEFYKRFLEVKLKKIRFEEKGGENIYTSDFLTDYEIWLEETTEEHKKLAFYAFFHKLSTHFKKVLPETQWIKIRSMMDRIKKAEEKTGLIDRIHDGVPRFVHLVFAEYFAVEFIADMLKMDPLTEDQVQRKIDFVVNCLLKSPLGIMKAFDHKLKNDEELRKVLDKDYTRKCTFTAWMEQDITQEKKPEREKKECTGSQLPDLNTDSYLQTILGYEMIEIAWFLLTSIKDNLNSANIEKFVDSIGNDFFEFAINADAEDLINYALDAIRRVDPSMIVKALLNCDLQLGDLPDNEFIIIHMRSKTKEYRTVVIKSIDTASDDIFYSIGAKERWQ